MKVSAFPAVGAWLVIAAAAGAQTPPVAAPTGVAAAPLPAKKICRREASTGSILATRTCHTKAEWDAIDSMNQANAQATLSRRGNAMTGQH